MSRHAFTGSSSITSILPRDRASNLRQSDSVNTQAKMALDAAGSYAGRVMITDRSKIFKSRSLNRPCSSGVASLARATSWPARCSVVNKVIQQQAPSPEAAKDLLNWLADRRGAIRTAVEVDKSPSIAGRRLLANRNLAANEVLMSVPLTSVFVDIEVSCQLIRALKLGHTAQLWADTVCRLKSRSNC